MYLVKGWGETLRDWGGISTYQAMSRPCSGPERSEGHNWPEKGRDITR